jgi:heptaprenylglyceryl phosphate synthase
MSNMKNFTTNSTMYFITIDPNDKKQFSNTKSIVKVETDIVTLISYAIT